MVCHMTIICELEGSCKVANLSVTQPRSFQGSDAENSVSIRTPTAAWMHELVLGPAGSSIQIEPLAVDSGP